MIAATAVSAEVAEVAAGAAPTEKYSHIHAKGTCRRCRLVVIHMNLGVEVVVVGARGGVVWERWCSERRRWRWWWRRRR